MFNWQYSVRLQIADGNRTYKCGRGNFSTIQMTNMMDLPGKPRGIPGIRCTRRRIKCEWNITDTTGTYPFIGTVAMIFLGGQFAPGRRPMYNGGNCSSPVAESRRVQGTHMGTETYVPANKRRAD